MFSTGSGAAKLSLIVVISLIILKVAVAAITGSISILAQAADSLLDLFAVGITAFAVNWASNPPDDKHPFGHGKAEDMAAIIQAVLLLLAGGSIIYVSALRIGSGEAITLTGAGVGVMLVSIAASLALSRHLLKVARNIDSPALRANAHNIAADVYSATAVLVGLLLVRFTNLYIIDPVIAILVAGVIFRSAYDVWRRSFGGLVDTRLPEMEDNEIKRVISEHYAEVVGFHKLRTRKAGKQRYIDLHLIMPKNTGLEEAHRMCDHLEKDLQNRIRNVSVVIHVEPCSVECQQCSVICSIRG